MHAIFSRGKVERSGELLCVVSELNNSLYRGNTHLILCTLQCGEIVVNIDESATKKMLSEKSIKWQFSISGFVLVCIANVCRI